MTPIRIIISGAINIYILRRFNGNCDQANQCKPFTFIKKKKYTEKTNTKTIKLLRRENFHSRVNE